MPHSYNLASDNCSGACPEAWEAMQRANCGDVPGYGNDTYTREACDLIRDVFETECEVFFTLNGTAANSLALATLCQSYHAVICHRQAHVETDECGAPEFYSGGSKLLLGDGPNGKLDPDSVEHLYHFRRDLHFPLPKALSVTQATELGTVYDVNELRELGAMAAGLNLHVHMDGARFANAVASLDVAPKKITWQAGVDVLCLGGSKNGMAVGEAVVFFNRELAEGFDYRCKQAGQLASKMRYLAAPWAGMLRDGAWLRHASHANHCAQHLEAGLRQIEGIQVLYPSQANAVFVEMPKQVADNLHKRGWMFYDFIGVSAARLMCSWNTRPEDIDEFIEDVKSELVAV